jgi:anti-sigma28 factor (negative regulator of flagellin synthesis)
MVATNDRIHRIASARQDRITRSSRVRLLARQVAAGDYRVDADTLADAIVRRAWFHRAVREELVAERAARGEG